MNKFQKELLEKCKEVKIDENVPLLDGIYILPTTRKHDSGYKIMNIVGYTDDEYYLLDDMCDVVDLGDVIQKCIKDIHIDISDNGIIHLWSNYQVFKSQYRCSSCTFDLVDRR
jgi:hypothetical protein